MVTVNVHEAKTQLSRLLAQVEAGDEVTIARQRHSGRPARGMQAPRQAAFGSMKGLIKFDDRFFDPLPEEELRMWEGG